MAYSEKTQQKYRIISDRPRGVRVVTWDGDITRLPTRAAAQRLIADLGRQDKICSYFFQRLPASEALRDYCRTGRVIGRVGVESLLAGLEALPQAWIGRFSGANT